jgi:hypothetical protein
MKILSNPSPQLLESKEKLKLPEKEKIPGVPKMYTHFTLLLFEAELNYGSNM